ncbi:hypothetical protein BS50DRAFT_629361 [Corynespora cassiicola Philippines]|uniref:Uncharacterized protein n=1 Tax=Corynespora cassiicola Philippines TaxID=1448308 RepID=A0A2T2P6N4_CORCC|nr:hypothetical protein BS50DRAFT_629361 [Corynespora cassiicola Philippines]
MEIANGNQETDESKMKTSTNMSKQTCMCHIFNGPELALFLFFYRVTILLWPNLHHNSHIHRISKMTLVFTFLFLLGLTWGYVPPQPKLCGKFRHADGILDELRAYTCNNARLFPSSSKMDKYTITKSCECCFYTAPPCENGPSFALTDKGPFMKEKQFDGNIEVSYYTCRAL